MKNIKINFLLTGLLIPLNSYCQNELILEKNNGFESAIYLYPPSVGMFDPGAAKWIIFISFQKK